MTVISILQGCILIASIINFSFEDLEKRIVGGNRVRPGEYPSIISLRLISDTTNHICGGTLIRDNFVSTAAHCFGGEMEIGSESLVLYEMMGGDTNREAVNTSPNSRQIMTAKKIFIHPKYDHEKTLNDIALIMLDKQAKISENFSILEMAKTVPAWNSDCTVIGWGVLTNKTDDFTPSKMLMKVDIKLLEPKNCENDEYDSFTPGMMLCAGDLVDEKDSCLGDSGGPLVCGNKLVGIVSYGAGCGATDLPGVYSSVVFFKTWIENTIENSQKKETKLRRHEAIKENRPAKRILNSNSRTDKIHGYINIVLVFSSVQFLFCPLGKIIFT